MGRVDGRRSGTEDVLRLVGDDSNELAEAIAELLLDRELRDALGARGRDFAERQMGVARTARAIMELAGQAGV